MRTQPLLETLDLAEFERVVVLSPHLDDAALSSEGLLGLLEGQISRLAITLSCANPPPKLKPDKTSARSRNRRGFASAAERRREDRAAMQSIRCDFIHLGFSDCIYRRSPTSGELIYKKPREILTSGRLHHEDGAHVEELYLVLRRLCLGMGRLLLLSPLGIGHHIDHVICANVAARLASKSAMRETISSSALRGGTACTSQRPLGPRASARGFCTSACCRAACARSRWSQSRGGRPTS